VARHVEGWLLVGLPLVALVHAGFGSFMAMQAFFRATIAESNGAVVGLGMLRSVAPMLTGFALAGLLSVRIAADLQGGLRPGLDDDPADVPDRDVTLGHAPDTRPAPGAGRVVAARVLAGALVGPLLTLWGAAVGTLVGAALSSRLLGLASGLYFGLFFNMLQVADVLTVVVTGAAYGGIAALVACHEALRLADDPRPGRLDFRPIYRAVLVAIAMMMAVHLLWFTFAYRAGEPLGPRVLAGPGVLPS
jgi:phospholipid/cholesterol/gamma-HCH transport system permease protein